MWKQTVAISLGGRGKIFLLAGRVSVCVCCVCVRESVGVKERQRARARESARERERARERGWKPFIWQVAYTPLTNTFYRHHILYMSPTPR